MIFHKVPLHGACLVELDPHGDTRGFFARAFCEREFKAAGLEHQYVQINNSLSSPKATLRGMHYQLPPAAEVKVVRCIGGAIYDVIVDLRADSPTFGQWYGTELTATNRRMLYVPRGVAHGFLTLSEDSEVLYLVSTFYAPDLERGVRYDDPRFAITWPSQPAEISTKDRTWQDFDPDRNEALGLRGLL